MTDDTRSQTEASPTPDPVGPATPTRRPRRGRRARALSGFAGAGIALGLVTLLPGTGDPQTTVCPGGACSIVASASAGSDATAGPATSA